MEIKSSFIKYVFLLTCNLENAVGFINYFEIKDKMKGNPEIVIFKDDKIIGTEWNF